MRIAVIGLGRIGSRLLRELAVRFPATMGVDIDPEKVEALHAEGFSTTTDPRAAAGADVYLVAVATGPRMEGLYAAASGIEPAPGGLVAIESTLVPGTMAHLAEIFATRGLVAGRDFYLVHSPHRILFGEEESIFGQPRVIGGITPACLARGVEFYEKLVPAVYPCGDIRLVELCKLVENTLRYLEITAAEALAIYCHQNGLDFEELRRLVGTKGNVRLMAVDYGIGGECLPKDARFLHGVTGSPLIAAAMAVDEEYRSWLFHRAMAGRVLVRGLTFKPGWRDLGFSRAVELVERLQAAGCKVFVADPLYTPEELAAAGFTPWRGEVVDKVVTRGKVEERNNSPLDPSSLP